MARIFVPKSIARNDDGMIDVKEQKEYLLRLINYANAHTMITVTRRATTDLPEATISIKASLIQAVE